ncbi:MAG: DUF5686 family protein [Bacteroidota bacterium]
MLLTGLLTLPAIAQTTVLRGKITDSKTGEGLPFASVVCLGTGTGTNTDLDGNYILRLTGPCDKVQYSYIGYKSLQRQVKQGEEQIVNVRLESEVVELKEVVVKKSKQARYRNKNNPAVELIREVIAHKASNKPEAYDYVEYEEYEKLGFSISNTVNRFKNSKLLKRYKFLLDNQDSSKIQGVSLLPVFLQERLTSNFYRKNPRKTKTFVKAEKKVSFEQYIDNNGLSSYLNHIYQDIDIYDNNISVVTNQFLSPISDNGPLFYQYFIVDTVTLDNIKLVHMDFVPRNTTDFLFQGQMYISLDGNFGVQRINMEVNKRINLNWVRELHVNQVFERNQDGRYRLSKSDLYADFGIFKGRGGIFGERTVSYRDYKTGIPHPDSLYSGMGTVESPEAYTRDEAYWVAGRHDSLSKAESRVYTNIDSLQKMPSFRRTADLLTLVLAGYKSFGPFEVGPVNTFYSWNPVEGFRLRAGGRTTPNFSKKINFETYGAYGFTDKKWKYYLGTTYSFTNRSIYEFPVRSLRLSYQNDTKIPGQELQFVQEDNALLSFKRGQNNKWLYNQIFNAEYLHELRSHISFKAGFKNWTQTPAGALSFVNHETGENLVTHEITTTELSGEIRWAPREQFYQGKLYRMPIFNRYPIFTLRANAGVKGILNSGYNYQSLTINIFKRTYLSQLGFTDLMLEGGHTFGKVPYPLLTIHRANQTYSYQLQSYNLMNFLEFVSDNYAGVSADHNFNGFIFNKIPLLKRAKLREVASLKVLWGSLRHENASGVNGNFDFPTVTGGSPGTFSLEKRPYIEGSLGIANIFKLLRVDVVKRFTYLDHPNVSSIGIRFRFKFDF